MVDSRTAGAPHPGRTETATASNGDTQRTAGQQARDEGAAAALEAAWPLWRMAAQEYLEVLAESGREFDAVDLVDEVGMPPVTGSPNAIGGLFAGALSSGLIEPVGVTNSTRRSRHAGRILRWRGVRP